MNTDPFAPTREFIDLTAEKRRLQARIKDIDARLGNIEDDVRHILIEMGDEDNPGSMRLNGHTVYLAGELWARPKDGDREATAAALKAAGLGWQVKEDFNIHSLSGWVREVRAKGPIREDDSEEEKREKQQLINIEPFLELSEGYRVRTRKA